MKKIIALAAAAMLTLTACGGGTSAGNQGSISNVIWSKTVAMPDGTNAQCVFFTNANGVAIDCNFDPLGAE